MQSMKFIQFIRIQIRKAEFRGLTSPEDTRKSNAWWFWSLSGVPGPPVRSKSLHLPGVKTVPHFWGGLPQWALTWVSLGEFSSCIFPNDVAFPPTVRKNSPAYCELISFHSTPGHKTLGSFWPLSCTYMNPIGTRLKL